MPRFHFGFWVVMASILIAMLAPAPASAQATRTWVSGVGDDANPCSRTAPCKTFAGAISKTASPGEINCLDAGGFGALTITRPVDILCDTVSNGGVLVLGASGITVNLTTVGNVLLSGLDLEGLRPNNQAGLNGIQMLGVGKLTIRNSTIKNFAQNGVDVAGNAGARVFIVNCLITNNAGGVNVAPISGANAALLVNSIVDANVNFAVTVSGASAALTIQGSQLTGSPAAIKLAAGGMVVSVGPSNFINGTGTPTSTEAFQ